MEKIKILSFQGETPNIALKKAQEKCGEDALVINTKMIHPKTLTSPALYEVVVAIENEQVPQQKDLKKQAQTLAQTHKKMEPAQVQKKIEDPDDVVFSVSTAAKQMSEIEKIAENTKTVAAQLKKEQPTQIQMPIHSNSQQHQHPQSHSHQQHSNTATHAYKKPDSEPRQVDVEELKTIKSEIAKLVDNVRLIQNMVWDTNEVMRGGLVVPPEFAEIYKMSRDSGMSEEHLYEIMKMTIEHMQPKMRESPVTVKRYFSVLLRKLLPIRHEIKNPPGTKKIVMLVGPTGVGKTTTLAKLAARYAYKLDVRQRVGIITLDTYRIGAVEQLMQYAKMMKLSIEAVVDPAEFKAALNSLKGCDYILIDTVGSSHFDRSKISKIANFLKSDSSVAIDTSLVVSASTKYEDLRDIYASFSTEMDLDTVIITKMDETKCFGSMFSLLYDIKKPVSYFSVGQEVPEDLAAATSEFFVDCLLDGFKAKNAK